MTEIPTKPEPQRRGYVVVLRPGATGSMFRQELERLSPDAVAGWPRFVADLRCVDPSRYAGWDRYPVGRAFSDRQLAEWPEQREVLIASLGIDPEHVPTSLDMPTTQAERLMTERLGENPNLSWQLRFVSESVIPDLETAREVLAATDDPQQREVIHLTRIGDDVDGSTPSDDGRGQLPLGFDVGTWGGPFSLISDTMLYPRWHPGPDEAVPRLREYAATLNEHMLFPTAAAAKAFREWYRGQPWAEVEGEEGDFCVARIERT